MTENPTQQEGSNEDPDGVQSGEQARLDLGGPGLGRLLLPRPRAGAGMLRPPSTAAIPGLTPGSEAGKPAVCTARVPTDCTCNAVLKPHRCAASAWQS